MDRDEEVGSGFVGLHCLLIRGLIYVGCTCVEDIQTAALENFADCQGEGERIVFFLSSVIYSAGIASAVSGVEHDSIRHGSTSFFRLIYNKICTGIKKSDGSMAELLQKK